MKNLPLTGRVNRHFGIKKQREIGTAFYCNHGAPPSALANANLAIKGYDSDATRLSVNDVPDFRGMVKRSNGVPYSVWDRGRASPEVMEARTNRQPSNSGCTRALSAMECEEQRQCGARKQDKPNLVHQREFTSGGLARYPCFRQSPREATSLAVLPTQAPRRLVP